MQPLLLTALVSLAVASLSSYLTTYLTIYIESKKLKLDLKRAYAVELFKKRLEAYLPVWEKLGQLSKEAIVPFNETTAERLGHDLNDWFFLGACAGPGTPGLLMFAMRSRLTGKVSLEAIRDLRDIQCLSARDWL